MSQPLDKISQFLGTAEGVTPPTRITPTDSDIKDLTKSLREKQQANYESDYDEARTNLKELVTESMSLLPEIISLTREAQSSGMYLAASAFIKMIAELNKDTLGISETKGGPLKLPSPVVSSPSKTEGNTAVFIGTSEEVFKQFSKRKDVTHEGEFIVVTTENTQEENK